MGFVMDGLAAEAYDRSYSDRALIQRIVGEVDPQTATPEEIGLLMTGGHERQESGVRSQESE